MQNSNKVTDGKQSKSNHQNKLVQQPKQKEDLPQQKKVLNQTQPIEKIEKEPQSHNKESIKTIQISHQNDEKLVEEQVRQLLVNLNADITQEEIKQFIKHEAPLHRKSTKEHFENWDKQRKSSKQISHRQIQKLPVQKQTLQSKEIVKSIQGTDKKITQKKVEKATVEPKKQQIAAIQIKKASPTQICTQFFLHYKKGTQIQIKPQVISSLNTVLSLKIRITAKHLQKFLLANQTYTLQTFTKWITVQQEQQIQAYLIKFKQTSAAFEDNVKKVHQIFGLANHQKSQLNVNLGVGQNKGKTSLKYAFMLRDNKSENFIINIETKTKKKSELKQMLEGYIKKISKQQKYNIFKLCSIEFIQLEKSLKIQIHSKIFEQHFLKNLIGQIDKAYAQDNKPILKVDGQLIIKNSLRSDQNNIFGKKFIKWIAQGFHNRLFIQGNRNLIQYFTSTFAEIFPIFKVIRSGDINLKLKNIENVDKLFAKFGISQICEQTPNLNNFITEILSQYFSQHSIPWISDLLKKMIQFTSSSPNQRIGIDLNIGISHLNIGLSLSADNCKQLGEIIKNTQKQQQK